jgi:hypothetical protein
MGQPLTYTLTVREEDGFQRRSFPCTTTLYADKSVWFSNDHRRLLEPDGSERPCQIDVRQSYDDGSVRVAEVTFAPFIEPYATRHYTFEIGGQPAQTQVRNPITIEEKPDTVIVRQGVMAYTVKKSGFNNVDTVVFQDKSFQKPDSKGPVLILKDGTKLVPNGPVSVITEARGPWMGRLCIEGDYPGGYEFSTRITFVSSKSWYLVEHRILSGDRSRIRAIQMETHFDLSAGPLSSAFGARVRHDGLPTNWVVFTDGIYTVDVAILHAWTGDGAVRCEIDADGQFRAIMPYADSLSRYYVHVLHGPPDDIKNTPAAAMAAELRCFAESHSNAKVTTS